jgi:hypothetical protein
VGNGIVQILVADADRACQRERAHDVAHLLRGVTVRP